MQQSFKWLWNFPYRLKYSRNHIFQRHQRLSFCRDHQTTGSVLQVYDSHFLSCKSCANPPRKITFANVTSVCDIISSFSCTLPGAKIRATCRFAGVLFFHRFPCLTETETNCKSFLLDSFAFPSLYNRLGMMDNAPAGLVYEVGIENGENDAKVSVCGQSEGKDEGCLELTANETEIPVNQDSSSFDKRPGVDVLHEGKIKEVDGSSSSENGKKAQSGEDLQVLLEVDNCNFIGTRDQRADLQTTKKFEFKDSDGMVATDQSEYHTECKGSMNNNGEDSFGLVALFDEDLQYKDASNWTSQTKKKCTKGRKRKRKLDVLNEESGVVTIVEPADGNTSPKERKRSKNLVPNYFVAIRVSNPEIHSGIKMVQDSIVAHNEKLKPTLIPLATLHLTLMVMHLEGDEQIQKAGEILACCKENVMPILDNSSLTLRFSGLDHFRHQVLYSKVSNQEEITILKEVANVVRETFAKGEIPSTDSRDFEPHLTVMKLSRKPGLRKKGIKNIPMESYSNLIDTNFGEEDVNALHLCSMNQKDKDGFYKCVGTVTFCTDLGNPPHSKPNGNVTDASDEKHVPCQVGVSTMESEVASRENDTYLEYENSEISLSNQDIDNSTSATHSDLSWEFVTWSYEDKVEYEMHMESMLHEGNQKHLRKRKRCMVM